MPKIEPDKKTKTKKLHWGFGVDAMRMMEYELLGHLREYKALPREWDRIWEDKDRRDTTRTAISIRLDADVVKFFKGLGTGYQARINRVLRAFVHFRLAKLVDGPDTMDYILRPDEVMARVEERPEYGDMLAQRAAGEKRVEEMREKLKGEGVKGRKRVLK